MTNTSNNKTFYTVWDWYDAPYVIRSYAPRHWDKGSWVIRGGLTQEFSLNELPVTLRAECEVVRTEIEGCTYFFIRDPKNLPWPPPNPKGFAFGAAETSDLSTGI